MYSTCIVTSIYNGTQYLEDYFKSIASQTIQPNKIYICNDGSTDDTLTKILAKVNQFEIEIVNHLTPKGLTFSLYELFNLVTEDLIFRLDVDDSWTSDHIERLSRLFSNNSNHILYFSYPSKYSSTCDSDLYKEISNNFLHGNTICHSAVMLNNMKLKDGNLNYNLKYKFSQDYEFWTRLILYSGFAFTISNSVKIMQHENSISFVNKKSQNLFMRKARQKYLFNLLINPRSDFRLRFLAFKLFVYYYLK